MTQYKLSSINQKVARMLVLLQVLESMWSLLWQRRFLNIPCKIGINTLFRSNKLRIPKSDWLSLDLGYRVLIS